jgi:hypothetical protein
LDLSNDRKDAGSKAVRFGLHALRANALGFCQLWVPEPHATRLYSFQGSLGPLRNQASLFLRERGVQVENEWINIRSKLGYQEGNADYCTSPLCNLDPRGRSLLPRRQRRQPRQRGICMSSVPLFASRRFAICMAGSVALVVSVGFAQAQQSPTAHAAMGKPPKETALYERRARYPSGPRLANFQETIAGAARAIARRLPPSAGAAHEGAHSCRATNILHSRDEAGVSIK